MTSGLLLALVSGLMAVLNLLSPGQAKPPQSDQPTGIEQEAPLPPVPAPSPESRAQAGMP